MKHGNPPRWAIALFRWFCNDHLADAVLGDLLELYDRRRAKSGKFKADIIFIIDIIQFLQPFALRKRSDQYQLNTYDMLQNYFTVAWRNMLRNKMYTGITIGGFALGLATCMLIALFIKSELSHDLFYKDGDRVFRLYNDYPEPGDYERWTNIQTPLASVIRLEVPDVELVGRLMPGGMGNSADPQVRRDDAVDNTFETEVGYVDPEILKILEIPMVYGNSSALDRPYTVVLSRRKAIQYFGDIDPVGKVLIFNEEKDHPYTVGGVMEDFRNDGHFQYDFLLTLKDFEFWPGEQTNWCCWNYTVYLKLRKDANAADVEKKMLDIRNNYLVTYMRKTEVKDVEDFSRYHSFKLQPLKNIWLQPEINDASRHGSATYVWIFGAIAIFILIIACINFINLSTARSANRAKEVGLRKVVGSVRQALVAQFLSESTLYSLISFVIASAIVWLALPGFSFVANRSLTIPWNTWWFLPLLISGSIVIGVIAGIYPSLYLSSFKPIDVLKGKIRAGARSSGFRSGMVVFQFTASIVLIIGTLVIYRHMNFLLSRDVGFNKDQVMIIEGTHMLREKKQVFKDDLLKLSAVENVSYSGYLPVANSNREGYAFYVEGRQQEDKAVSAQKWRVEPDYVATMKMKIVEGRDFIQGNVSDSSSVIINQTMARNLNLKDPIGARITNKADGIIGSDYTVIGVVEDFNFQEMTEPVLPLCLVQEKWGDNNAIIRLKSNDMTAAIESITRSWSKVMPNQPIRYSFLDDRFKLMYDEVLRAGQIFAGFATLAIIIGCLGLFALSAFVSEQRSKEISIRRVMGASIKNIFGLLTGNFMKLVMISWIIGTPIAWYAMNEWLSEFTYREPIASEILIISGLVVAFIALSTVAYQSIKAAVANPVDNLRQT